VRDDLAVAGVLREAKRESEPLAGADAPGEDTTAACALVPADILEQQCRAFTLQHLSRDGPDLAVPAHRGGYAVQLALPLQQIDPLPQVQETRLVAHSDPPNLAMRSREARRGLAEDAPIV